MATFCQPNSNVMVGDCAGLMNKTREDKGKRKARVPAPVGLVSEELWEGRDVCLCGRLPFRPCPTVLMTLVNTI